MNEEKETMQEAIDKDEARQKKEAEETTVSPKEETTDSKLEKILDRVIPEPAEERKARRLAEQESNYRLHPDKVVVLEISMSAIDKIDGTNGWYDIVTGSEKSIANGLSETIEFTKQGLILADRFEVKLNRLPQEEWTHEYIIVDRKEWEESRVKVHNAMLDESGQVADLMMRRGME